MSASIITRIQVGDHDTWRPMFDQDRPQAREKANVQRVFRMVDDPNNVFVFLEFDSVDDAEEARQRLVDSGVLEGLVWNSAVAGGRSRPSRAVRSFAVRGGATCRGRAC